MTAFEREVDPVELDRKLAGVGLPEAFRTTRREVAQLVCTAIDGCLTQVREEFPREVQKAFEADRTRIFEALKDHPGLLIHTAQLRELVFPTPKG